MSAADFPAHIIKLTPHTGEAVASFLSTSPASRDAFIVASTFLPAPIFNHSVRVFLHALEEATRWPEYPRPHLLYVAAMLHDLGATSACAHEPCRFEVAGADRAAALLETNGADKADVDGVWRAIALHTTVGIAERMGPPVGIIRVAVRTDFGIAVSETSKALAERIELVWPRLDVEICLGNAVVEQVIQLDSDAQKIKAPPASWPGALVAAYYKDSSIKGINPAF